ncbi:hypothetical protein AtNW77_Chr1g0012081 [Arabidopsis thaliana]
MLTLVVKFVAKRVNLLIMCCSLVLWLGRSGRYRGFPLESLVFKVALLSQYSVLFELRKIDLVSVQIRRSWPWVLWRLWKNRNKLFFEGVSFCPLNSIVKIREDVQEWFLAQSHIRREDPEENVWVDPCRPRWEPPSIGWVKCNVGAVWSGKKKLCGGSWVVRDEQGKVLLHSRRAFGNLSSKKDSLFICVLWAIERMASHRFSKVLFAFEPGDLLSAFVRPKSWPFFAF